MDDLNETVTISLWSNQNASASDLYGKQVHVIYGEKDKVFNWYGTAIKIKIPMNMSYQVVFPTDSRYYCSSPNLKYTAVALNKRSVTSHYYAELVTVNVTCSNGASPKGQQVTIYGKAYTLNASGSASAKVPWYKSYTVSLNAKTGYTTPSSVTYTANSKTRTVSMVYTLSPYGVFVEATDGVLYPSADWTSAKTANSIVVKQSSYAFRIALTEPSVEYKIHSNSTGALENYMTAISSESLARDDMKSVENTINIMKLQSGTGYAAGYCNSFIFPDGRTRGVLPALGWWKKAFDNKTEVISCLSACGATAISAYYLWSSTFSGVSDSGRSCWIFYWPNSISIKGSLGVTWRVRPFATYEVENTIIIDQTIDDPYKRISGDINGNVIQWIRNNSHRVLAKKTADGVLTYCRLNDADSNQYYDGTTAALDGTQGDVFLKLPEFYYKGTEGDRVEITFAKELPNASVASEYIRWDPNTLIGVYESYELSSKAYSRSGVVSTKSKSQSNWKTYAAARGTGYQLVDWQMHCVMGCLYYAKYGNTNCQSTVGQGYSSYTATSGQTNNLGMTDTVYSSGNVSINFWGLENWWGDKYEYIHDYENPASSLTATVNDPVNGGKRSLTIFDYGGYYIKKMKFGRYLDLIATTDDPKNGTGSVGYCDYQYWPGSTSSSSRVLCRSSHYYFSEAGVAYAYAGNADTSTSSYRTSRLAFRGTLIEETSVSTFKNIAITN